MREEGWGGGLGGRIDCAMRLTNLVFVSLEPRLAQEVDGLKSTLVASPFHP